MRGIRFQPLGNTSLGNDPELDVDDDDEDAVDVDVDEDEEEEEEEDDEEEGTSIIPLNILGF